MPLSTPPARPTRRPLGRLSRRTVVALAAAGCVAPLAVAAPSSGAVRPAAATTVRTTALATTYQPTSADRRIAQRLGSRATTRNFGRYFSGTVVDVASGRVVWARNGGTGRMPASTAKLVTATNALTVFGPAYQFMTTVRRATSDPRTVTLVGVGDPSLSSADLQALARQTAADSRARGLSWVRVRFDDYRFARPTLASGWKSSYVPTDVRWVRALVVDGHHVSDTSRDAAQVFARYLAVEGVKVSSVYRSKAVAPAPVIASVKGDRLDAIVRQMLLVSDNDHAEALHRMVARAVGQHGTWTGARIAQRAVLAREGILLPSTAMKDGSGLSRSDRLTTTQLARVVANAFEPGQDDLAVLRTGALPVAGRTGTLKHRFAAPPVRCAIGKVAAKTGSLSDASSLAGYTVGKDGRLKAFAFIVNHRRVDSLLRRNLDALAATVNGCY
ncbi:D-alanyl-D-alanine carboxypeptidase/D-alanyl-D-alanine-endopeptidase [Angustibacter sp. Root456]|uniref:D-alanyl-D-alanine carboxypeptidase/D-alanyl-D-alanine endopeptidase n=1 Tax=Angustibacter sp. Root456 TaxID=1736539 RepID=UPI0012FCF18E|nr:D-alanyl-D-alanine carboxypeptidase/D-alanyl-D-alanine-endopeptidase [Angustibacter sp. Root456]